MLLIEVPENELWDERSESFIDVEKKTIKLEQ